MVSWVQPDFTSDIQPEHIAGPSILHTLKTFVELRNQQRHRGHFSPSRTPHNS